MKKFIKIILFLSVMVYSFTACKSPENKGKSIVIDSTSPMKTVRLHSPDRFEDDAGYFEIMDYYEDKIVVRNNVSRNSFVGFAERTADITVHSLSTGDTEYVYTVEGEDVLVFGAKLWEDILYVSEFDIDTNYHNVYSYQNGKKQIIAENIGNRVSQFGPYYNPLVRTDDGLFFEDQRYISDDFIYRIMKAAADGYSEYYSRKLLTLENAPYGLTVTADGKLSYIIENSNNKREYMQIISGTDAVEKEITLFGYDLLSLGNEMLCIEKDGDESFYLKIRDKDGVELASHSFFGVGELMPAGIDNGYLTITTYTQSADNNHYLYYYKYSDTGIILTPVEYDCSFNFSTIAVNEKGDAVILRKGKSGEKLRYSIYTIK